MNSIPLCVSVLATFLASAVTHVNAAAPTIASDGQDLLIEAGEGGDVVFRKGEVEIKLSQLTDVVATVAQQVRTTKVVVLSSNTPPGVLNRRNLQ